MSESETAFWHGPCQVRPRLSRGRKLDGRLYWSARSRGQGSAHVWSGWALKGSPEMLAAIDAAVAEKGIEAPGKIKAGRPSALLANLRKSIAGIVKGMNEPEAAELFARLQSERESSHVGK